MLRQSVILLDRTVTNRQGWRVRFAWGRIFHLYVLMGIPASGSAAIASLQRMPLLPQARESKSDYIHVADVASAFLRIN